MKRLFTTFTAALALTLLVVFAGHLGHTTALGLPVGGHFAAAAPQSNSQKDVCEGVLLTGGNCTTGGTDLGTFIKNAISILSIIVGIAAVVMIIVAGFRFVTSAGDANGISTAKRTLIYALVGLVVAALAQTLVHFVLSKATA